MEHNHKILQCIYLYYLAIPAPVIDTPLDDRDGGIVPFGKSSVVVTSFNHTLAFQRQKDNSDGSDTAYRMSYLDCLTPEEEACYLGITFRISHDCGVSFGELYKSPVTSPHGPLELPDGTLLWVGRADPFVNIHQEQDRIEAHRMYPDGSMAFVGAIDNINEDGKELLSCEPHAIRLKDGRILTLIRAQKVGEDPIFTLYQSVSDDDGKTWSKPKRVLDRLGGAPAHLCYHSSGVLICTYGYREHPYGVKVMFSHDEGKNWEIGYDLYTTETSDDLGYPATVELTDGSLLTVFYALEKVGGPAVIMQQKWSFEE